MCLFGFRYGRAEVMAGFVNGLFLIFVAFFIFSEAVEVNDGVISNNTCTCRIFISINLISIYLIYFLINMLIETKGGGFFGHIFKSIVLYVY